MSLRWPGSGSGGGRRFGISQDPGPIPDLALPWEAPRGRRLARLALALVVAGVASAVLLVSPASGRSGVTLGLLGVLAAYAVLSVVLFRRTYLRVDHAGVTWCRLLLSRTMGWEEIRWVELRGGVLELGGETGVSKVPVPDWTPRRPSAIGLALVPLIRANARPEGAPPT